MDSPRSLLLTRREVLNEFRFQYAQRIETGNSGQRNEFSGTGPSIVITGVANFRFARRRRYDFPAAKNYANSRQSDANTGTHVVKFGGGFNLL